MRCRLEVLGATRLRTQDGEVPLTAGEARLLAGLALVGAVGTGEDRLVQLLWPGGPPRTAQQSLRKHVSRLRHKTDGSLLRRTRTGYRLGASVAVDVRELEGILMAARAAHQDGGTRAANQESLAACSGSRVMLTRWLSGSAYQRDCTAGLPSALSTACTPATGIRRTHIELYRQRRGSRTPTGTSPLAPTMAEPQPAHRRAG